MVATMLGEVAGEDVLVDCAELLSGSPSFAAGLVEAVLVDGRAASMTVANAPETFARYVIDAARELRVADRFDLRTESRVASR